MDSKELIDYVGTCYELEKNIYFQTQLVNWYKEKQSYFRNYESRFKCLYNSKRTTIPFELDLYCNNPDYKYGFYTSSSPEIGDHSREKPHSKDEVIIYINATKNMTFHFWQSDRSKAQMKLDAYNRALEKANNNIVAYNNKIKEESLVRATIIETELKKEVHRLMETKQILKGFYDKNIVFVKYRSFIAISSILEYLVSGRCNNLPEAYNKYEEEIRQDIINGKLDTIIGELEAIEENQYMLYDAIMTANKKLGDISSGINKTLSSLSQIEDNSVINAYNSTIIAENEKYQNKLLTFDVTYRTLRTL